MVIKTGITLLVLLAGYGIYLDATIRTQFENKRWTLPTRVYARPMELFAGAAVTPERLTQELKQLGYQKGKVVLSQGTYLQGENFIEIYSRSFRFWDREEPGHHFRVHFSNKLVSEVLEVSSGALLYRVRLEPQALGGIYPSRAEDRLLVKLEEVPPLLVKMLLAVEDKDFYTHHGLSLKGTLRAILSNIQNQELSQGGSTLTQQLVKNFFLTHERTLLRKLREIPMALLLEAHYSKHEILETYLNEVFLGQEGARAIHGFGMGSYFYFGRPLKELRVSQFALLVGLIKGASYYQPWRHPQRARVRRNLVLRVAEDSKLITKTEAQRAFDEPLGLSKVSQMAGAYHPAFMDLVRRELKAVYSPETLSGEDLKIFTTLDPIVQQEAEKSLSEGVLALEFARGVKTGTLQGAVVVMNPKNGEVLAVVGDRDPRRPGFNRALDSQRSIGSLVKPAVYLTALSRSDYHLASTVQDEPIALRLGGGKTWNPQNSDQISHGPVRLYEALAHSYNQATVQVGLSIGLKEIIETLRNLGVESLPAANPSLILGAFNLSPLQVAKMYQTIATLGYQIPIRAVRGILGSNERGLDGQRASAKHAFSAEPVYLVYVGMQQVIREGTGRRAYAYLSPDLNLAGKTGTTDDGRDSWFAGFSEDYLAVVWVGRDDYQVAYLSGASAALPIWAKMLQAFQPRAIHLTPPPGIEMAWVDKATGFLSSPECPGSVELPFIRDTLPKEFTSCGRPTQQGVASWFEMFR